MTTITTYPLVEVRAYRKVQDFEVDAQKRLKTGWTLQGQSGDSGHVGLGSAAAGYLVAGLPGMIGLQGMRKGKTVVTWIHPNPSPWQIQACEARKAGKQKVHVAGPAHAKTAWFWFIAAIGSFMAALLVGAPLLFLTLGAVFFLVTSLRGGQDISIREAY